MQKFACNECDYVTSLHIDLWKHKMKHDGRHGSDTGDMLLNVLITQQTSILEQIAKSEARWETQLQGLKSNQDLIHDEIKSLKETALGTKKEILDDISAKVDKITRSMPPSKSGQPDLNQPPTLLPKKKKILLVGDSLSRKLNLSVVRNVTDMEVKRVEAFIVGKNDPKAKVPSKNFTETVPRELRDEDVNTLILQGGTKEISNLYVSGNISVKMEAMKEEVKASSVKLFNLAENRLTENKDLEKVIILKRIFRCDTIKDDPSQIKSKMSEYGNRVIEDVWLSRG